MTEVPGARGTTRASDHTDESLRQTHAPSAPSQPPAHLLLCPICLDYVDWQDAGFWRFVEKEGRYEPLELVGINNPVKLADQRRDAYLRCPNPAGDMPLHYLPAAYQDYGPPVVIGLVGEHNSGKTHLLTAMILEMFRGGLTPFGLSVEAIDRVQHKAFHEQHIQPFVRGMELAGTREGVHDAAESLLITTASGASHPVTFFDVAGEDFKAVGDGGRSARFLLGINALMFVEAPELALSVSAASTQRQQATGRGNEVFPAAFSRLRSIPHLRQVPAAIVLAKSDRLRYLPPVDGWIRNPGPDEPLDAGRMRAESKDVYAFLHQHEAQSTLRIFAEFDRCTLHFVSATGGESDGERYPRRVRPARVLQPLLALLAMAGVIEGTEARKVGT
jgi:hypothetical protein